MEMVKKKKGTKPSDFSELNILLVVVALVLVAGGAYYIWGRVGNKQSPRVSTVQGGFVSGFPREFILESGVTPEASSLSTYSDNSQKLWSASYVSKLPASVVIQSYQSLFTLGGWEITNRSSGFLYAKLGKTDVSVTAKDFTGGSNVLINVWNK